MWIFFCTLLALACCTAISLHLSQFGILSGSAVDSTGAPTATLKEDSTTEVYTVLPLLQSTLHALVANLCHSDIISIVTFGDSAHVHLPPAHIRQRSDTLQSIDVLRITGSTNVGAGIQLGYTVDYQQFNSHSINRVVFIGDGVANNGITTSDGILRVIAGHASKGIALTMTGMGMGTYNDKLMEELANRGNGKYFYIDSERKLRALLGSNLTGLLDDIAHDAKIQVEFDPLMVEYYWLIGYENRGQTLGTLCRFPAILTRRRASCPKLLICNI